MRGSRNAKSEASIVILHKANKVDLYYTLYGFQFRDLPLRRVRELAHYMSIYGAFVEYFLINQVVVAIFLQH
jgi:hypothetical protein